MNTTVVGRVAVRVLPDTSGFKERLRRDLAKETAGVDADVPVNAELDADQLERELRAKVEELKDKFVVKLRSQINDLKKQVARMTKQAEAQSKADPITFQTEVDGSAAKLTGGKIADEFIKVVKRRRIFSVGMDGVADLSKLAGEFSKDLVLRPRLDASLARAEARATQIDIPGRIVLDYDRFSAWMKVYASYLKHRPLELEVRPTLAEAHVRTLRERLRALFGALKAKIQPHLDRAAAAIARTELEVWFKRLKIFTTEVRAVLDKKSVRGVQRGLAVLSGVRLFKELVSLEPFKDIDKQLPKIALMATLIGQAGNFMLSLTSDALSLGRGLAAIVPAALALPGIFVATGVALYALIKPLAQFNDRLPEIAKGLSAMQDGMVSSFWDKAHDGMASLAALLPALTSGFKAVGASAGNFMGTLAQGVSTRFQSSLTPFLGAISASFDSLSRAARPMARIMGNFTDLGTVYLPRLARAGEAVTKRFADFFDASMKNGKAFQWVDRGVANIKALGGVVAGVYRIMDGLSAAAEKAGGATLQGLAAGLDRIQKTVKSDAFQSGLINVFRSARIAIEEMTRIAGPSVSKMFATMAAGADQLLPRIGQVAGTLASFFARIAGDPVVGKGLVSFFSSLQRALNTLDPSVSNVAKGLGGVLKVLGKMLTSFAPIVEIALGAVSKHAEGMLISVERIIDSLSTSLGSFLRSLMPAIDALSPAILGVAESLARGIGGALTALGPVLSGLLQAIAPAIHLFSRMPPIVQLLAVAFGVLAVALGRVAIRFAPTLIAAKGLRGSFDSARGVITRTGEALRRTAQDAGGIKGALAKATVAIGGMSARLPGLISGLGKLVGIFGAVGSAAGLLSAGVKGPAAGIEEISLAMEKLAKNGDLSGFDRQFQNTKNLIARGATDIQDAFTQLSFEKYMKLDGLNKAIDGSIGQLLNFKSATGEMRDVIARLDSELAALYQRDPSGATRGFEEIKAKALAAGWTVEDLDAAFIEFKSSVERNGSAAASSFAGSVDEVKKQAQELQSSVNEMFNKTETQVNGLKGKAQREAISQLTKSRADLLKGLAETTSGLDAEMVKQAAKLNSRINSTLGELNATKDAKTKDALKSKLDGLLAEYKQRFGELPSLITDAVSSAKPGAVLDGIFSGHSASAAAAPVQKMASQIKTAFADAKAAATTGSSELKTALSSASPSASDLSLGEGFGENLATQIRSAFASASAVARLGATALKATLATSLGSIGTGALGATLGSKLSTGVASGFARATSAARAGVAGLNGAINGGLRSLGATNLTSVGSKIGSTFAKGIRSKASDAKSAAKSLSKGLSGAVKVDLSSNGSAVGASYVRGLRSQIPAAIAAAKALGKATKDNKGPISYDRVMLIPEGVATVQGYIAGLRSQIPDVERTMRDITKLVAGTDFDDAIKQANRSANNAAVLGGLSVGTSQYITQVGDVTIDVSELDGIKTVDDFGRTLRRKRRQRGGK